MPHIMQRLFGKYIHNFIADHMDSWTACLDIAGYDKQHIQGSLKSTIAQAKKAESPVSASTLFTVGQEFVVSTQGLMALLVGLPRSKISGSVAAVDIQAKMIFDNIVNCFFLDNSFTFNAWDGSNHFEVTVANGMVIPCDEFAKRKRIIWAVMFQQGAPIPLWDFVSDLQLRLRRSSQYSPGRVIDFRRSLMDIFDQIGASADVSMEDKFWSYSSIMEVTPLMSQKGARRISSKYKTELCNRVAHAEVALTPSAYLASLRIASPACKVAGSSVFPSAGKQFGTTCVWNYNTSSLKKASQQGTSTWPWTVSGWRTRIHSSVSAFCRT